MNGTNWQPIADKVTVGATVAFRVRGSASDSIMEGTVLSASQRGLVAQVCASHYGRRGHHSVKWCHVLSVNGVNVRTVLTGPSTRSGSGVALAIMRKSWTGRIVTYVGFGDVNYRRIALHVKKEERLMSDDELTQLCACGFDIPKQLRREVVEHGGTFRCPDQITATKLSGASMLARAFCPRK